jgi:hypothetical protein
MRPYFQNKFWILAVSVLALGALTVLAVGLRDVSFQNAQRFGREEEAPAERNPPAVFESFREVSLQSQVFLWGVLALMVLLIGFLLSPELRKKMIRIFIRVALTYWMLYYVLKNYGDVLASLFGFGSNFDRTESDAENLSSLPPPVFTPPRATSLLSYGITVLTVLLLMYLAWRLVRIWRELNLSGRNRPLDEIARIARLSLRDLSSGRDSTDVIMNCYFRMSDVVADKRRLRRMDSMTPAEFAIRLEEAGLPGENVRRLTHLFEDVRYGGRRPGPREINEAVACLTTIVTFCGEVL